MKTKTKKNVLNLNPHKYPLIEFNKIVSYIQKLLSKKYFVSKTSYQKTLIKNIIYDDKRRLVSLFKEQLIINDTSEYLKRFYQKRESYVRLNKYYKLYEEYSKLFPNYTPLIEAKYIYSNIHRKQKIIDLQQNNNNNKSKKHRTKNKKRNNKIFSSDVYESIEKNSENLNSAIFGINKDELENSIFQIENIINNIDNLEINFDNIDFGLNQNKIKNIKNIKNKNIIINNYYYNNNSILTKNIPIESLLIHPNNNNIINTKNFSIIKNNILTNLKKNKKLKNNNINSCLINKDVKNVLSDTFKMINSTKNNKNKNKSVINNTSVNTNTNNASNSLGIKNLKNVNKNINIKINKNNTQQYSNNIPHTTRLYHYKNLKLNSIIKKLTNGDINSSTIKNENIIKKDKIKIDRFLISQIINERLDSNIDKKPLEKEKNKTRRTNRTSRDKENNKNKLKIYLDIIKKKGYKESIYSNKQSQNKTKILTKKFNYDLKTDRGIYNLNNINNINQINKKKSAKKNNKSKIQLNKKNYISTNFLINENRIKNKHKKLTSENNSKNLNKYASININNNNSKMKIKGIQIKNFNKIFNVNKEKTNDNYIKTSERSKRISMNIKNIKNIKNNKQINITKNKINKINNNINTIISYTEREKAKRIFFSNNI